MIAIVNISGCGPECDGTGPHTYEVRINEVAVATFTHKREEGLSVCLEKAARAVRRTETVLLTSEMDVLR